MTQTNWTKVIAEWEASGLTQTLFCTRNNLVYKEFVKQRCKAIAEGTFEKRQHSSKLSTITAFSKLDLHPTRPDSQEGSSSKPLAIEINLPNGINLRIPVC